MSEQQLADALKDPKNIPTIGREQRLARRIVTNEVANTWEHCRVESKQAMGLEIYDECLVVMSDDFFKEMKTEMTSIAGLPVATGLVGISGNQTALVTALIIDPEDKPNLPPTLRIKKARLFSTVSNVFWEVKMDGKPMRREQGKLTYNLLNEQSVAARPVPLQAAALQTPMTWAEVISKKEAHEKRLTDEYEAKRRAIDGQHDSDSEEHGVPERKQLSASAAGLESSHAAATARRQQGKGTGGRAAAAKSMITAPRASPSPPPPFSKSAKGSPRPASPGSAVKKEGGEPGWSTISLQDLLDETVCLGKQANGNLHIIVNC